MRALSVLDASGSGSTGDSSGGSSGGTDVRARMVVSVLASLATVAVSNLEGQILLAVVSFGYALTLRRPVVLLCAYAFMAVMCLMALGCTELMRMLMPHLLRDAGLASLLVPFLRMLTMLHVVLPLALGSRLQNMLDALRGLRLPFCIYLPAAVMLRFIPAFVHDVRQVAESLRLRGFAPGVRSFALHPLLTLRLVCTPLLFRSLRASEDLGIAAELKGLGQGREQAREQGRELGRGQDRGQGCFMTSYRCSHWGAGDSLLVLAALTAVAGAVFCQYWLGSSGTGGMR